MTGLPGKLPPITSGTGMRAGESCAGSGSPGGATPDGLFIPPVSPSWELDALRCEIAFLRGCNRELISDNENKALLLARAREQAESLQRMSVEDSLKPRSEGDGSCFWRMTSCSNPPFVCVY